MYQRVVWGSCVGCILFLSLVSAQLQISPPAAVYNQQELLPFSVTVTQSTAQTNFLTIDLICTTGATQLYRAPLTVGAQQSKTVTGSIPLSSVFVGIVRGSCTLRATYGSEQFSGAPFTISTHATLHVENLSTSLLPGSTLAIKGTATLDNGKPLSGTLFIRSSALGISLEEKITNGSFTARVVLPGRARTGTYTLSFTGADGSLDALDSNQGTFAHTFQLLPVLTSLDVALSASSLFPGTTLSFTPRAFDQGGDPYTTPVHVTLRASDHHTNEEQTVPAGQAHSFALASTSAPGTWYIQARAGETTVERTFDVVAHMNASFVLTNTTLIVTNTGNVPYTKAVSLSIGDTRETKQLSLPVGGSKQFQLSAPDGTYTISANDGERTFAQQSFLTGNAISITDSEGQRLLSRVSIGWVLLLLVLAGIVIYYYRRVAKQDYYGHTPSASTPTNVRTLSSLPTKPGNHQRIDSGVRRPIPLIALKMRSHPSTSSNYEGIVNRALDHAKGAGGEVRENTGYWLVFFPQAEAEDAGVLRAVKVAEQMHHIFEEYNQHKSPHISYGLAVHFDELIIEQQPFRYTSIGNTLMIVKKLAEYAEQTVFVSDTAHKFIASTTRSEKIPERNAWKLKSISNRERHNQFIRGFMKRQGMP